MTSQSPRLRLTAIGQAGKSGIAYFYLRIIFTINRNEPFGLVKTCNYVLMTSWVADLCARPEPPPHFGHFKTAEYWQVASRYFNKYLYVVLQINDKSTLSYAPGEISHGLSTVSHATRTL